MYLKRQNRIPKQRVRWYGRDLISCFLCKGHKCIIRRRNLNLCRKCFRENYRALGFLKD